MIAEFRGAVKRTLPPPAHWPIPIRRALRIIKRPAARRELLYSSTLPQLPPLDGADAEPRRPPIFVLSAGWRSGSTAVQRLIISGGDAFIFGEPFANSRLLPRLHRLLTSAMVLDDRASRTISSDDVGTNAANSWVAELNPPASDLLYGARQFLHSTYWRALADTTFQTWGAKEVALTSGQIDMLRALFPDAQFILIVRDPAAAYRSFKNWVIGAVDPHTRYLGEFKWITNPISFGRVWVEMATKFRALSDCSGVNVFKYEDIVGKPTFPSLLGDILDMRLDSDVWENRVGSSPSTANSTLTRAQLRLLRHATAPEADKWGY